VHSTKWGKVVLLAAALTSMLCFGASAQFGVDTMTLDLHPPDSFSVERDGSSLVITWYPPADSISKIIGSRIYTNWYGEHTNGDGVDISFSGYYSGGLVDRKIRIEKRDVTRYEVGVTGDIPLVVMSTDNFNRTYEKVLNIGSLHYTPGDDIPLVLGQIGLGPGEVPDTLDLGFSIQFSAGVIDTSLTGGPAFFLFDVQDFEGFHVWRGLSPLPSEQQAIVEISKEDYFKVSEFTSIEDVPEKWRWLWEYFNDNIEPKWPRKDDQGRWYYQWVDDNVYPGITYYYSVTTFDRGYFRGFNTMNKWDNFRCDEDLENPEDPSNPVDCESASIAIEMTVDAGSNINEVYTVPNPYRTGTSAETTPYYHNYPDGSIKFFNVPGEAQIKIFTVAGDLVWEGAHYSEDGTDGIVSWDVRNKEGQEVGSGVYIYRVEASGDDDVYGRIVVIR